MPGNVRKELDEGSEGASRKDVSRKRLQLFDSGVVKSDVNFGSPHGFDEKRMFSRI